tara:strand:+ start:82 stop:828 length:747 start_codon:yes stop_codon:yes gene_type:complete
MSDTPNTNSEGGADGTSDLEQKVQAMSSSLTELDRLIAKERKLRWITVFGVLAVVCILLWMMYSTVANIDQKEIIRLAEARAPQLANLLSQEARQAMERTIPDLREQLKEKLESRRPQVEATLKKEMDSLVINLQAGVQKLFESELKSVERDVRMIFKKHFPDLTQEQVLLMVENLHKVIMEITEEFVKEHMEEHVSILVKIDKTLEGINYEGSVSSDKGLLEELKKTSAKLFELKLTRMLDTDTSGE